MAVGVEAPRRLILSLYGLYARDQGDWLSVSALIALMADLGVDSAAVRSSVSRLKKRGVLEPQRRDGRAGYALSDNTLAVLREGDRRIWHQPRATAEDGWLLLVFSVPESMRQRRHALRSLLGSLGFGTVSPGVWIAPRAIEDETVRALDRAGLAAHTELFRGDRLGSGDVAARVGEWWDLDEIAGLYADFVAAHGPGTGSHGDPDPVPEPRAAFAAYVPLLTSWRRLPYRDPGLPLAHLPDDWPGIEAERLFERLDERLRTPAAEHALAVVRG